MMPFQPLDLSLGTALTPAPAAPPSPSDASDLPDLLSWAGEDSFVFTGPAADGLERAAENAISAPILTDTQGIAFEGSLGELLGRLDGLASAKPGTDGGGGGGKGGGGGGGGGKPGSGTDSGLLTSYTAGGDTKTSYNIDLGFSGEGWTTELQTLFTDAADFICSIIIGELSDERVPMAGRVDDLYIDAEMTAIDGAGNVLGQTGVVAYRTHDQLPAYSFMQFDTADAQTYLDSGLFGDIVLHEMLHAVGIGGQWDNLNLVSEDGLYFTGALANAEYAAAGGTGLIPIEQDYGPGTAGVHWDEETFGNELMTGLIDASNTLSAMTIASLADMGYETTYVADTPLVG
ncbi:leishmanolysin-related zinc metalloendopeptidase [Litorisediminicola beolgyonensis]|uniref:Leishmanolysin-related zinc metalloendopeptidase n=1 Tax=Litorisediminicola beolgyonensis TaxID=1173614 RepID=A0ABW3ZCS0_9RHOB